MGNQFEWQSRVQYWDDVYGMDVVNPPLYIDKESTASQQRTLSHSHSLLTSEKRTAAPQRTNVLLAMAVYVCVCVAGFKMKCMKSDVLAEPAIQVVDHHSTISSSDTIKVQACLHNLAFDHTHLPYLWTSHQNSL